MTTDPLLPAELLDILDHAHPSPLWPAIGRPRDSRRIAEG